MCNGSHHVWQCGVCNAPLAIEVWEVQKVYKDLEQWDERLQVARPFVCPECSGCDPESRWSLRSVEAVLADELCVECRRPVRFCDAPVLFVPGV